MLMPSTATQANPVNDHFLVCGLGSMGQHCVKLLKEFGVTVVAINISQSGSWEVDGN